MSGFSLNLGDPSTAQGFVARCKDIFGAILEHTPKVMPDETEEKNDQEIQECAASIPKAKFQGKESIFRVKDAEGFSVPRRPDAPRFQRGRGRAFVESREDGISGDRLRGSQVGKPRKYIKYSLADVDELSDKSNARAAFDFLRERREQQQLTEAEDQGADSTKITFKRPAKKPAEETEEKSQTDKSSSNELNLGGVVGFSKRILPECVVGAGPKFRAKREPKKIIEEGDDETGLEPVSGEKREHEEGTMEKVKMKKSKSSAPKLSFAFEEEDE